MIPQNFAGPKKLGHHIACCGFVDLGLDPSDVDTWATGWKLETLAEQQVDDENQWQMKVSFGIP